MSIYSDADIAKRIRTGDELHVKQIKSQTSLHADLTPTSDYSKPTGTLTAKGAKKHVAPPTGNASIMSFFGKK